MTPTAKAILGEADLPKPPAHWGNLPGYGEPVDLKKIPPYVEDLGNGVTHKARLDGSEYWRKDGELHRDGDKPAIINADGTMEWWVEGQLHRDGDQPAIIWADGAREWYDHGKLHRDGDQPAIIAPSGTKYWYKYGLRHRDGGKPAVIWADGGKDWWVNGDLVDPPTSK